MTYDLEACGARIRELRTGKAITQQAAAEALNCSAYHYRRVEKGREGASIDLLIDMAEYFGTTLDYLVLGKKETAAGKESLKKAMLLIAWMMTEVIKEF